MGLPVHILAEKSVQDPFLVEAMAATTVLSSEIGIESDPQFSFQTLPDDVLTRNRAGQVTTSVIGGLPRFRNGGMTLVVVANDLGVEDTYPRRLSFVYGTSFTATGNVIASTRRMPTVGAFGALVLHESGHSMGLVPETAKNHDRISTFAGHCVNQCIMQPVNSQEDLLKMETRYNSAQSAFCLDCSGLLRGMVRR